MGIDIVRGLIILFGVLMILGGFAGIAIGGSSAAAGIWGVVVGLVLVAAVVLERTRYRSAHAEETAAPPGPGGGEPHDATLEARFRSTDEVFVDPTTGRRMRVWVDPATGERRYRAEG